jgi:hypothetical protein
MKAKEIMIEKRSYFCPEIVHVVMDNEISLALESVPPPGPLEMIGAAEFFTIEPMQIGQF